MAGRTKWTEAKIQEFKEAKRGEGHGKNYIPWLNRLNFSSSGRCRSTGISPKTGRIHEFFSDVEYHFFLCLERDKSVLDIREQFPLDRELTQEVARMLSITHPTYPVTQVAGNVLPLLNTSTVVRVARTSTWPVSAGKAPSSNGYRPRYASRRRPAPPSIRCTHRRECA